MAQRIVGLDIGTSAIRAVEMTIAEGSAPVLEAYGQVGIPPGAVIDGEIRDRLGISQAIERLWREGGFAEKKVHVGIAGLRAITRELDMPTLPPDELNDAVRYQADEVVPFPLEKTAISSKVIAQYTDAEGAPTLRVLLAAAHRDLIDALVATTQQAGLEPIGIDLNTAALVRSLYDPSAGIAPEAIVSVGAGLTMVVVHQAGVLQFVRTIDLGGETVTKSIASALDLPLSDAEGIKRRLGDPDLTDDRAHSAAEQAVDDLVTEIHNSIRFFASLPGRSPVTRLLLTGGGASTFGFLERLEQGMDMPVVAASPLARVDTSGLPITPEQAAAIDPTLAVPVGLALPDPTGTPFNLLPQEVTEQLAQQRLLRNFAIVGVLVLAIMIGLSVWRVLQVNSAANHVKSLQSNVSYIKNHVIPKYDPVLRLIAQVNEQQTELKPTLANQIDLLVVINQLSLRFDSTPPGATTTAPQAVLSNLTITQAPPQAATSTSGSGTSGAASSATKAVLGTLTTQVQVPTLAYASTVGDALNDDNPAFSDIYFGNVAGSTSSGASSSGGSNGGYQFSATMNITSAAVSHRLASLIGALPS